MPLEIIPFVGGPVQTNAFLVADPATGDALVIDAPYETAAAVVAEAARRGWTIGRIIITHTHWDHVSDAKALKEATGAPLLAHPLAVDRLARPVSLFGELPVPVPPVETRGTLDDGDSGQPSAPTPSASSTCRATNQPTSHSSTSRTASSSAATSSSPAGTAAPISPARIRRS